MNRKKLFTFLGASIILICFAIGVIHTYLLQDWLIPSTIFEFIAKLGILGGLIICLLGLLIWQEEALKQQFSQNTDL
ncbi:MAG: hypothetical protein ACFFBD_01025 [Candidatus Hodarchaeota archaeon]